MMMSLHAMLLVFALGGEMGFLALTCAVFDIACLNFAAVEFHLSGSIFRQERPSVVTSHYVYLLHFLEMRNVLSWLSLCCLHRRCPFPNWKFELLSILVSFLVMLPYFGELLTFAN
jgi:hypothetical protein